MRWRTEKHGKHITQCPAVLSPGLLKQRDCKPGQSTFFGGVQWTCGKKKESAENKVGEIFYIAKIEQDQVCLLNRHWVLSTGGSAVEGRTVWGNGTPKVIVLIPGFFIKSDVIGPPPRRSLFHPLGVNLSVCDDCCLMVWTFHSIELFFGWPHHR